MSTQGNVSPDSDEEKTSNINENQLDEETTAKRGRGRPPIKNKADGSSHSEPSTAPPSSASGSATTTDSGVVENKRIRRKPSKLLDDDYDQSSSFSSSSLERPACVKRKRGRPPGITEVESPEKVASDSNVKKRGRPKLTTIVQESSENKEEESSVTLSSESGPVRDNESKCVKSDVENSDLDSMGQEVEQDDRESSSDLSQGKDAEDDVPSGRRKRGRPPKIQSSVPVSCFLLKYSGRISIPLNKLLEMLVCPAWVPDQLLLRMATIFDMIRHYKTTFLKINKLIFI